MSFDLKPFIPVSPTQTDLLPGRAPERRRENQWSRARHRREDFRAKTFRDAGHPRSATTPPHKPRPRPWPCPKAAPKKTISGARKRLLVGTTAASRTFTAGISLASLHLGSSYLLVLEARTRLLDLCLAIQVSVGHAKNGQLANRG